jgi:hypothetical protein
MDPACSVWRETASRNNAVEVWMEQQVLSPGVKDSDEPDVRSKMFRIAGDLIQRRCRAPKQEVVEKPLVVKAKEVQFMRKGEDHMKVRDRKEFGLTRVQPMLPGLRLALRAVPVAAAVVRDDLVLA